jgi:hypothetical protein
MTVWRFVCGLIIVAGVLIAGFCGLCTLMYLWWGADLSGISLVLIVGGTPTLIGVAMVWAGVVSIRQGPPRSPNDPQ